MKPIIYALIFALAMPSAFALFESCHDQLTFTLQPTGPDYDVNGQGQVALQASLQGEIPYLLCILNHPDYQPLCQTIPGSCDNVDLILPTVTMTPNTLDGPTSYSPASGYDPWTASHIYTLQPADPPKVAYPAARLTWNAFGHFQQEDYSEQIRICRAGVCTPPVTCPQTCTNGCGTGTYQNSCGDACRPGTIDVCGNCDYDDPSWEQNNCAMPPETCVVENGNPQCVEDATTTAFATEGKVHLCGTHWNIQPPYSNMFVMHPICTEKSDLVLDPDPTDNIFPPDPYVCIVTDAGWQWGHDTGGQVSTTVVQGTPAWGNLTKYITEIGGTAIGNFQSVVCDNGILVPGLTKYNPDKSLLNGCPINKCYIGPVGGGSDCADVGEVYQVTGGSNTMNYVCASLGGNAFWETQTSRVARSMLNELEQRGDLNKDYVLNCGSRAVAIGDPLLHPENGYCQLALLDTNGAATEIWTAIGLAPGIDGTVRQQDLALELASMHAIGQGTSVSETINGQSYAYYNEQERILLFSTINVQQPPFSNPFGALWNFLQGFFLSAEQSSVPLIASGAEEVYVRTEGTSTAVLVAERLVQTPTGAFLDSGEECTSKKSIRNAVTNATMCYTDARWRTEVQKR